MKTVNKISQILAAVFGLAALVLFCFTFGRFTVADGSFDASGLQIAFGAEVYGGLKIARSARILLYFWMSVLSFALAVFTFFKKSKTLRYWWAGISLATAIFMLVITLSKPGRFIDRRPFAGAKVLYSWNVMIAAGVVLLAAIFAIVHMFVYDYLDVVASKGAKKPLFYRVLQFFKDYKSEVKKIVWPGLRDVVKNTVIVLIMCLIIGVIIWLADWGLGSLLKLLL